MATTSESLGGGGVNKEPRLNKIADIGMKVNTAANPIRSSPLEANLSREVGHSKLSFQMSSKKTSLLRLTPNRVHSGLLFSYVRRIPTVYAIAIKAAATTLTFA